MRKLNSYTTDMINEEISICESITNKKLRLIKESDKPYYLISAINDKIITEGSKKEILNFLKGFNRIYDDLMK